MSDRRKILLAMSGGVDSTAAVIILRNENWDVIGVTLDMGYNDDGIDRAARSCKKLGIKHIVRDCRKIFEDKVVSNFVNEYAAGRTPSPCVICNRQVKFTEMLNAADELGIEFIATGHYAQKVINPDTSKAELYTACDLSKDQSYMLSMLTQEQLRRTVLPLSDFSKQQIRVIAAEYELPSAGVRDSQDICFDGGDYRRFLQERGISFKNGLFIDSSGNMLGYHNGLPGYTPGQRRGLGVSASEPLYVLKKDSRSNTVTLVYGNQLGKKIVHIGNVSWIDGIGVTDGAELEAKLRYAHSAQKCSLHYTDTGITLHFNEAQRAPAPGQIAVIYDGNRVLGGGIILGAE